MAQRKTISTTIVSSDKFSEMSADAQALYFHAILNSDTEGHSKLMALARGYCLRQDAIEELSRNNYVYVKNGRYYITDWAEHDRGRAMHAQRESKQYKQWRSDVMKRDGHACKRCGSTSALEVHHIIPFADDPQKRLDVENGVTLCKACHISEHGGA